MTLSYKIIKGESADISNESVEVISSSITESKDLNVEINASEDDKGHFFSNTDSVDIEDFKLKMDEERSKVIESAIKDAEAEIEALKEEAKKAGHKEGYDLGRESGYNDGFNDGYNESLDKYKCLLDQADESMISASTKVAQYFDRQKEQIINLSGKIAERIINNEIDMSSQIVIDMIGPIISSFREKKTVIVFCSKDSLSNVQKLIPNLKEVNKDLEYITMVDPRLNKNDITIEYGNQIIDLSIKEQIKSIIDSLLKVEV